VLTVYGIETFGNHHPVVD